MDVVPSDLTLRIQDTWDFLPTPRVHGIVFLSWELPPPSFLKVNFDGSVADRRGGAGFVIHGSDS